MVNNKTNEDSFSQLYAGWVSASVKLSVAGFAASAKMLEAASQNIAAAKKNTAAPAEKAKEAPNASTPIKPAAPDDLKRILGIGPKLEQILHRKGITSFAQIAAWTPSEIKTLDETLSLSGRIKEDNWVAQARQLTTEQGAR